MDSRGSIAVEFLVLVPLLVLIWQALSSLHGLNATSAGALAGTRACAWRAALAGCQEIPPGCDLSVATGAIDPALESAAGELALRLPLVREPLAAGPPRVVEARRDTSAPSPLWNPVPVRARHLVPCNPTPGAASPQEIARGTCRDVSDSCR